MEGLVSRHRVLPPKSASEVGVTCLAFVHGHTSGAPRGLPIPSRALRQDLLSKGPCVPVCGGVDFPCASRAPVPRPRPRIPRRSPLELERRTPPAPPAAAPAPGSCSDSDSDPDPDPAAGPPPRAPRRRRFARKFTGGMAARQEPGSPPPSPPIFCLRLGGPPPELRACAPAATFSKTARPWAQALRGPESVPSLGPAQAQPGRLGEVEAWALPCKAWPRPPGPTWPFKGPPFNLNGGTETVRRTSTEMNPDRDAPRPLGQGPWPKGEDFPNKTLRTRPDPGPLGQRLWPRGPESLRLRLSQAGRSRAPARPRGRASPRPAISDPNFRLQS